MKQNTQSRSNPSLLSTEIIFTVLFLLLAFGFQGCTKKEGAQPAPSEQAAAAPSAAPREVNLSIWADYLTDAQVAKFTEKTGIKLNISNFSSNEELLAKIQSGASGIDVAVPSDYMVSIMSKLDLLEKIDAANIPNSKEVSPDFLKKSFDPANEYSLPYAWSTTGIAIHKDLFKGSLKTWKDFFTNEDLKGKVSLLDDVREVMAAALKSLGFSVNSQNPAELKKAKDLVKQARKRIKMFRSETIDALINKEVAVAQTFSTDALQAAVKSEGKIEFIIPEDGGAFAIDNLVIIKGSKNAAEARELINFILSVENNVEFVEKIMAGPVLTKTKDLLPEALKNNSALFPSSEVLSKMEALQDLGDFTEEYDKAWTEIKSN